MKKFSIERPDFLNLDFDEKTTGKINESLNLSKFEKEAEKDSDLFTDFEVEAKSLNEEMEEADLTECGGAPIDECGSKPITEADEEAAPTEEPAEEAKDEVATDPVDEVVELLKNLGLKAKEAKDIGKVVSDLLAAKEVPVEEAPVEEITVEEAPVDEIPAE